MDNLNTHTPYFLYDAFEAARDRELASRLEIYYTPKHWSWLNIAEIGLSALSRQCLSRRISDLETLNHEHDCWQEAVNADRRPMIWQFTTDDAKINLNHLDSED